MSLFDPRVWLGLAAAILIAVGLGEVHGRYRQHKVDDAFHQAYVEKQRALVTTIALNQATNLGKVAELESHLEAARLAAFQPVTQMVRDLPVRDAHIRVPDSVVRVLDAAVAAAADPRPEAKPAGAAARLGAGTADVPQGAGEAVAGGPAVDDAFVTVADWAAWSTVATEKYRACKNRVIEVIAAYDAVRAPTL